MQTAISSTIQTWTRVLTRPGTRTFAEEREKPSATLKTALTWIVVAAVFTLAFTMLRRALMEVWTIPAQPLLVENGVRMEHPITQPLWTFQDNLIQIRTDFTQQVGAAWARTGNQIPRLFKYPSRIPDLLTRIIYYPYIAFTFKSLYYPFFFLGFVFIYHYVAKRLGGTGKFGRYAYLMAAFSAPIDIIRTLVYFLPLVGTTLAPLILPVPYVISQLWYFTTNAAFILLFFYVSSAYWIVLTFLTTRAEHRLNAGKAAVAVVTTTLLVYVLRNLPLYAIFTIYEAARLMNGRGGYP